MIGTARADVLPLVDRLATVGGQAVRPGTRRHWMWTPVQARKRGLQTGGSCCHKLVPPDLLEPGRPCTASAYRVRIRQFCLRAAECTDQTFQLLPSIPPDTHKAPMQFVAKREEILYMYPSFL